MNNEEEREKLYDIIDEIGFDDDRITEMLPDFYNSPSEVFDLSKCTEKHFAELCETFSEEIVDAEEGDEE